MGIFSKNYIIGLDIGAVSLKWARFMRRSGSLILLDFGCKEFSAWLDNDAKEIMLLDALKALSKKFDFKGSKLIVAINCPKTAMRRLTSPKIPIDQLHEVVEVELKNYFPFSVTDSAFDLEVDGEVIENERKKYRLIVATSFGKTLEKHVNLLNKAGLYADAFVPAAYGLEKLFSRLRNKEEFSCLLDIGASASELVIFKNKEMVFSRKIPVGGNDFTRALARELVSEKGRVQISEQEAEEIKRECGLPQSEDNRIVSDKVSSFQVLSMLRPVAEQLASEIVRCLDYYREEVGELRLNYISLLGGGSYLKGLDVFLKGHLGMEVKIFNPLEGLKIKTGLLDDTDNYRRFFAGAIGAALSEGKGINLLPSEIKEAMRHSLKRNAFEIVVLLAACILLVIYFGLNIRLDNLKKSIAATQMEIKGVRLAVEDGLADNLSDKILVNEPHWEDVFKELSNVVPDNVYLNELSVENKAMRLRAVVVSGNIGDTLSGLSASLSKGLFVNAKIIDSSDLTGEFTLECSLD